MSPPRATSCSTSAPDLGQSQGGVRAERPCRASPDDPGRRDELIPGRVGDGPTGDGRADGLQSLRPQSEVETVDHRPVTQGTGCGCGGARTRERRAVHDLGREELTEDRFGPRRPCRPGVALRALRAGGTRRPLLAGIALRPLGSGRPLRPGGALGAGRSSGALGAGRPGRTGATRATRAAGVARAVPGKGRDEEAGTGRTVPSAGFHTVSVATVRIRRTRHGTGHQGRAHGRHPHPHTASTPPHRRLRPVQSGQQVTSSQEARNAADAAHQERRAVGDSSEPTARIAQRSGMTTSGSRMGDPPLHILLERREP